MKEINEAYEALIAITPTFESVDDLVSEEDELEFVKAFREIIRLKSITASFTDLSLKALHLKNKNSKTINQSI